MDMSCGRSDASSADLEKGVALKPGTQHTASQNRNPTLHSPDRNQSQPTKPNKQVRHNVRSRDDFQLQLNEDEIYEVTQHHLAYTHSGYTLKGLAKFDDCVKYGITQESERVLVRKEIKQLIASVSSNEPFLFSNKDLLGETTATGYHDLSSVADQMFCNLEIIRHDNAALAVEHCPDDAESAIGHFKRSRRRLFSRYKQDQKLVQGGEPHVLQPPERNRQLYFALVDYIVACIGRVVVRVATGKYWTNQTLSILALWAMKLKAICYDPVRWASLSLANGEQIITQISAGVELKQAVFLKIRPAKDANEQKDKDVDVLDAETDISSRYYYEKYYFRKNMRNLMKFAILSVMNPEGSNDDASCFETCTLVYKTGLEGLPTVLSNNREGEVSASSDPVCVNASYSALDLAFRNAKHLSTDPAAMKERKHNPEIDTTIRWEWSSGKDNEPLYKEVLRTGNMGEVVSVAIPMALTTIYSAAVLDGLISLASNGADDEDPPIQFEHPPKEFQALFIVTTADWVQKQRSLKQSHFRDPEVRPVSNSPMGLGIRAGTNMFNLLKMGDNRATGLLDSETIKVFRQYEKVKAKMDGWVLSEDSITIRCRLYAWTIMAICLAIVAGGLVVPWVIGAFHGIDPFQITTFSWVIAGFVAIVAQSRFVNDWPWHDFLRGQVRCRGVKDVCDVTGIKPQIVLLYLLHEERDNTLRTRGPYNGMFFRQAEDLNGFAIDEACQLTTMLASGFIILKVLNENGEHLICIDVRKGTGAEGPLKYETSEFLACMDTGRDAISATGDAQTTGSSDDVRDSERKGNTGISRLWKRQERAMKPEKVKKLSKVKFQWNKMLGVYVYDSKFG